MKARILVIEDEMSINDLLCMNLEIAGYETVGYLDGNEAYEAIIQDHAVSVCTCRYHASRKRRL